jgi:hypothetical protein
MSEQFQIPRQFQWRPGEQLERREQQLAADRAALNRERRQLDRDARMVRLNQCWLGFGWVVVMAGAVLLAWLYQSAPRW